MPTLTVPEIGQTAPDFKLRGPGGQFITLSEHRGSKNVVLVFFPLAFSPTCAHHLPTMEEHKDRFEKASAVVLGVSVDNHFANEAFARQLRLSFPLLSDFGREACAAYGVLNLERGHGGRAVFVVDRQGKIVYREISQAPGDPSQIPSAARILEALEALS